MSFYQAEPWWPSWLMRLHKPPQVMSPDVSSSPARTALCGSSFCSRPPMYQAGKPISGRKGLWDHGWSRSSWRVGTYQLERKVAIYLGRRSRKDRPIRRSGEMQKSLGTRARTQGATRGGSWSDQRIAGGFKQTSLLMVSVFGQTEGE